MVLACWFRVSRSTITRAVRAIRPLLAEWGCPVEDGIVLRIGGRMWFSTWGQRASESARCHRDPGASPRGSRGRSAAVLLR
ncbi:transposase family protein [Geodermatophilus amargosae]|uniref:transposase family protein n=1 Tax=Geodermatophilus amargosae TaxID=1296565 RepID=UPI000B807879|nr:transposase family protein [Geodermatophilus amargosae]